MEYFGLVVLAVLAASGLVVLLGGCVSVGKGTATLIPAPRGADEGFDRYFPDLVTTTETMRPLTPRASTNRRKYEKYLKKNGGCETCKTSQLSVVVRDRTKTPPFVPIDIRIEEQLLAVYLDKELSSSRRDDLSAEATARSFNVPDLPNRTTLHDFIDGRERFFYYPRVQVEFSSKLSVPSQLDRFAYLGMVLKLNEAKGNTTDEKPNAKGETEPPRTWGRCASVRFIDFQPKAADIVEYTRGVLTQKADAAAKAALADHSLSKVAGGTSTGPSTGQTTTASERAVTSTLTPEISLAFSETFINALKDSIEARTAGILEEGQALFADFRAIKNRRIGGTYTLDVMLEVPTQVGDFAGGYASLPCVDEVKAEAYLVSVVRHVYKRGFTGLFTRVPEPDNDKVYYQVAIKHIPDLMMWKFPGEPWSKAKGHESERRGQYVIAVITNRSDARYVIKTADNDGRILGSGSGAASQIAIPSQERDLEALVEFLDVIETESGAVHVFAASRSEIFRLEKGKGGRFDIVGNYRPKNGT